jgi:hypothetical protein
MSTKKHLDANTGLTQLFFRAKQTSKRMVFRTAGVIQRVTRTAKRRRDLVWFASLDEYKVELNCEKLACFGFFPPNQS